MASLGGTPRLASFIDLAEAKDWMQFSSPSAPSPRDAALQRVIDMACWLVQRYINRPASPQTFTERHDGWSGEYIMVRYTPFLSLNYCNEWQSSGGMVSLAESTPEAPVDGIQIDYVTGRIMRTFAGYSWPRPFFPGSRNIEISYVAGYNPTPPDLWMATMELVAHWWRNTQQAAAKGFGGAIGGERANDPEQEAAGLWQGLPYRVTSILDVYRLPGIG